MTEYQGPLQSLIDREADKPIKRCYQPKLGWKICDRGRHVFNPYRMVEGKTYGNCRICAIPMLRRYKPV